MHSVVNNTVSNRNVLVAAGVGLDSYLSIVCITGEGTVGNGYVSYVAHIVVAAEVNACILINAGCIELNVLNSKATGLESCTLTVNDDSTVDGVVVTVKSEVKVAGSYDSYVRGKVSPKSNSNVTCSLACSLECILNAEVAYVADVSDDVTAVYEVVALSVGVAVGYVYLNAGVSRSCKLCTPVVSVCGNSNVRGVCHFRNGEVRYATLCGNSVIGHSELCLACSTTDNDSGVTLRTIGVNGVLGKSDYGSCRTGRTLTCTKSIAANTDSRIRNNCNLGVVKVNTVLRIDGTAVNQNVLCILELNSAVHSVVNGTAHNGDVLVAACVGLDSYLCLICAGEGTLLNGYVSRVTNSVIAAEVDASVLGNAGRIELNVLNGEATGLVLCALAVNGDSTVKGVAVTLKSEIKSRCSWNSYVLCEILHEIDRN